MSWKTIKNQKKNICTFHPSEVIFSKIAYKQNVSKILFNDINSVLQRPSFVISVNRFDSTTRFDRLMRRWVTIRITRSFNGYW